MEGSGQVQVTIQDPPDPGSVTWTIVEEDGLGPIALNPNGPTVSFMPDIGGNYLLSAWNGPSAKNQLLSSLRFAIVTVSLNAGISARAGLLHPDTGFIAPASGMQIHQEYVLRSGRTHPTFGTNRVVIGDVGNLIGNTFAVTYQDGSTLTSSLAKPPAMLDTSGSGIFRASSTMTVVTGASLPPGLVLRVDAGDNPAFSWSGVHPATGSPVQTVTGHYTFQEYLVAYSTDFPEAYAALYCSSPWYSYPCQDAFFTPNPIIRMTASGPRPNLTDKAQVIPTYRPRGSNHSPTPPICPNGYSPR